MVQGWKTPRSTLSHLYFVLLVMNIQVWTLHRMASNISITNCNCCWILIFAELYLSLLQLCSFDYYIQQRLVENGMQIKTSWGARYAVYWNCLSYSLLMHWKPISQIWYFSFLFSMLGSIINIIMFKDFILILYKLPVDGIWLLRANSYL